MIVGIGNDIIEQERVKKACEKDAFLLRVYTEAERMLIAKKPVMAADNWAVKESVVKALGVGFTGGIQPIDIECLRDKAGKPYVLLRGQAYETARSLRVDIIHVTISNAGGMSSAMAVAERDA